MKAYRNAKASLNKILEKSELFVINKAVTFKYRTEVKKRVTKKIDKEYIAECSEYWRKYTKDYKWYWHQYYYEKTGIKDARYIPDDLYFTYIDQYFNNRRLGWGVNDKNYYNVWFPEAKQPKTVIRKINGIFYDFDYTIITLDNAIKICQTHRELIVKPSLDTGAGSGIVFMDQGLKNHDIKKILSDKSYNGNLIVQEIVRQHEFFSNIHETSLNTLRIVTLLESTEVKILSAILRMGIDNNKVDNGNMGGIACGIHENGKLKNEAFDLKGNIYTKHPQGFSFKDESIPSFEKAVALAKQEHKKMAHFRLISWDIAIDENSSPLLIEANLRNGGIKYHQYCNGPIFGEYTDDVLSRVFNGGN